MEKLVDLLKNSEALAEQHTREIFGNRQNLPADESAIAWNQSLTHEQKMEKLTALRGEKALRRAARKRGRRRVWNRLQCRQSDGAYRLCMGGLRLAL